ncbi:glycerol-3-phosphate dehydrogenase [Sphingomonas paeninsulae]|uniref:Glycerol-3-phosphate dehydrogenase n=1 Tax=Sphingomonas paeninsulae TaxID=2319844 RepID=A0A494TCN6_SPHPE|nr:glycerol-3-phosphate dehydrogenase [Sphingomonas paeninsulae]AYJ87249.1 glycerol-3-phosphate dehydrogenase [Sphingomonas paeninsulae]
MVFDLLIVGGGINGTAIAREAALNGLSVMLVERDDLASHTSSASTKLVHGGLRYLEYYEFGLVREALQERERLLKAAPHLIYPMHFVLPHENAVRPWWLVRLGLLLYDNIGGRITLPRSRALRKTDTNYLKPLKRQGRGFVYSDAWVDDARLVVLNAMDAARHGAEIVTHTAMIAARRVGDIWEATLSDGRTVQSRAMVNAAGPWVAEALALTGANARSGVRLIKGSHIVVPKIFDGAQAYMLQQPDKRIVFAIAYANDTTLIGTTDIPVERPEDAQITPNEISYLCEAANHFFVKQIAPANVVRTYSGVRPLYDDGASEAKAVTRDYVLELDAAGAPLLSVFGGKITTARHLAEEAIGKLAKVTDWQVSRVTRSAPFPGGDIGAFDPFLVKVLARYPFLGEARSLRMARAYGSMLFDMIGPMIKDADDLGEEFGAGLSQTEVDWMVTHEWAHSVDDVIWRRSKLGLAMNEAQIARLADYLKGKHVEISAGGRSGDNIVTGDPVR